MKYAEKILGFLGTVTIPTTTEKFIPRDKFVVDTSKTAKVKISYVWDDFSNRFGDRIEEPISEHILRYNKLGRSSSDGPIIAELGGEQKAVTTLTEVFSLMEKQPNGEKGVLQTNGRANIFYIPDTSLLLHAVFVYWASDGWRVYAYWVTRPGLWLNGVQVFSRRNPLES